MQTKHSALKKYHLSKELLNIFRTLKSSGLGSLKVVDYCYYSQDESKYLGYKELNFKVEMARSNIILEENKTPFDRYYNELKEAEKNLTEYNIKNQEYEKYTIENIIQDDSLLEQLITAYNKAHNSNDRTNFNFCFTTPYEKKYDVSTDRTFNFGVGLATTIFITGCFVSALICQPQGILFSFLAGLGCLLFTIGLCVVRECINRRKSNALKSSIEKIHDIFPKLLSMQDPHYFTNLRNEISSILQYIKQDIESNDFAVSSNLFWGGTNLTINDQNIKKPHHIAELYHCVENITESDLIEKLEEAKRIVSSAINSRISWRDKKTQRFYKKIQSALEGNIDVARTENGCNVASLISNTDATLEPEIGVAKA